MCYSLWVTDKSTRKMFVVVHCSLVPKLNNPAITGRGYQVAGLILIFIHVASNVDLFFMCLIKCHDLSIDLIVIYKKLAKLRTGNYFLSVTLILNRTKTIHLTEIGIAEVHINYAISWIFQVNKEGPPRLARDCQLFLTIWIQIDIIDIPVIHFEYLFIRQVPFSLIIAFV